jgi:vacuolar-type H+-ATPase subunit I/STV1
MTAIAELFRLPETKAQRETFVSACVEEILSGVHNVLNIEIQLKNLEETIKAIRANEKVKDCIHFELAKYAESTFQYNNVRFTKKQVARYDYTNDSKWNKLNEQIKEHEAMLKNLKEPVADIETGEIYQPAMRKSTDSYSITFSK